ncbi:MAG TPA: hypothetical protein DCM05_09555 [Elusimicrobia bacterium]|nr:hypothetical protein [Elusimicrobiota bacterium]
MQGLDKLSYVLIAALSKDAEVEFVELERYPLREPGHQWCEVGEGRLERGISKYLTLWPREKTDSLLEHGSVKLQGDAIMVHYFGDSIVLHYYDGGKFKSYVLGE